MFVFNGNNKLEEEIILIGFQWDQKEELNTILQISTNMRFLHPYTQKMTPWEPSCFGIESDKGSGRKDS